MTGRILPIVFLALVAAACSQSDSEDTAEMQQVSADAVDYAGYADFAEAASSSAALHSPPEIYATLGPGVGRIEFEGELHNGERETGTGSGFLVSADGFMLTCKHVVPVETNYSTVETWVRFGSKTAPRKNAEIFWTSPDIDLVVLKVDISGGVPIPLSNQGLPPGNDVVVLGFPLNLDLNITRGIVSGFGNDGRHIMDAIINAGNSGGPVIGPDGTAVGIAWGAALRWKVGGETHEVEGVKFFIPMADVLGGLPPNVRSRIPAGNVWANKGPAAVAEMLSTATTVAFTKSDHPSLFSHSRTYEMRIPAEAGYRIVNTAVSETSRNNSSRVSIEVSSDGSYATARAELESGSMLDQWRGWMLATVELEQERRPN